MKNLYQAHISEKWTENKKESIVWIVSKPRKLKKMFGYKAPRFFIKKVTLIKKDVPIAEDLPEVFWFYDNKVLGDYRTGTGTDLLVMTLYGNNKAFTTLFTDVERPDYTVWYNRTSRLQNSGFLCECVASRMYARLVILFQNAQE